MQRHREWIIITLALLILLVAPGVGQVSAQSGGPAAPQVLQTGGGRRVVVAFLGDSYASGEGSPNLSGAKWTDAGCHRSESNGRASAAKRLAEMLAPQLGNLPRLAVTPAVQAAGARPPQFGNQSTAGVSLAWKDVSCSGATIGQGILSSYSGVTEMNPSAPSAPRRNRYDPQVFQIQQWLRENNYELDALFIAIGGNDVGFARVVSACMTPEVPSTVGLVGLNAPEDQLAARRRLTGCSADDRDLADLIRRGAPTPDPVIGFDDLESALTAIDGAVRGQLNPQHIFLVGYPDPTRDDQGEFCHIYDDGVAILPSNVWDQSNTSWFQFPIGGAFKEIEQWEAKWIYDDLVTPMNKKRQQTASKLGWEFIDVLNFTRRHGYCAKDAWFHTLKTSLARQGDYNGTAHPNAAGYRVYEEFILTKLVSAFDLPVAPPVQIMHESYRAQFAPQTGGTPSGPQLQSAQRLTKSPEGDLDLRSAQVPTNWDGRWNLVVTGLLFPTPNPVQEVALEWGTSPLGTRATSSGRRVVVPVNRPAHGEYTAQIPASDFDRCTTLYLRWRASYSPKADRSMVLSDVSDQLKLEVNCGDRLVRQR